MIEVTKLAQEKINEYFKEKVIDLAIRIYMNQGGWSGPSLAMALDEPNENDDSHETAGINYLIDKKLSEHVGAVKIDFVEQGWRSGFVVSHVKPVTDGHSACGTSCSC